MNERDVQLIPGRSVLASWDIPSDGCRYRACLWVSPEGVPPARKIGSSSGAHQRVAPRPRNIHAVIAALVKCAVLVARMLSNLKRACPFSYVRTKTRQFALAHRLLCGRWKLLAIVWSVYTPRGKAVLVGLGPTPSLRSQVCYVGWGPRRS